MKYLLNAAQMKAADQYTIHEKRIPSLELMERAAKACVDAIKSEGWHTESVCIVCGSGNNGGDGFAIGRLMEAEGIPVKVVFAGREEGRTPETIWQMEQFKAAGGKVFTTYEENEYSIVIDALFGIGLCREVKGYYGDLIEAMNRSGGKKLAVDIPSGISASSGKVLGHGFRADLTVTFQECKLGMVLYPGREYTGVIHTADIGIDSSKVIEELNPVYTLEKTDAARMLPARPADSHKGTYGKVLLIAGSKGMAGAAYMSAYAAYLTGAGLVQIYTNEANRTVLQQLIPEAIISSYDTFRKDELLEKLAWADVVCAGPGIGTEKLSEQILKTVLEYTEVPCLIDADGLNIISLNPEWQKYFRDGDYILTPHMKELSRLTRIPIKLLKEEPEKALNKYIEQSGVVLVMKDARTFVGAKNRRRYLNLTGNAAMAKAGAGDVLAGIITGFLAQGLDSYEAGVLGVYLHGAAGDFAREQYGSYSVMARDLAAQIKEVLKELEKRKAE